MNSDHRRHDQLLVTRYAAGDSYPSESAEAEALVAGCSDCARLAADIRLLSQRTRDLPSPRRQRDFRISADQAERLRGGWFERLMRGLAAPGWGTALRPVAGAAMAIGLTLAVVGAMPLSGAPAALDDGEHSIRMQTTQEPAMAPEPAQEGAAGLPPPAEPTTRDAQVDSANGDKATDPDELSEAYLQTPEPELLVGRDGEGRVDATGPTSSTLMLAGGVLLAGLGAVALVAFWFARRRFGDALLR